MSQVIDTLDRARRLGFLGSAPVESHIVHARGFVSVLDGIQPPRTVLDLGSGAGVPGLVMAWMMPETRMVLLDSNLRKTKFLTEAVVALGLGERVTVVRERAEVLGRLPEWREALDVVVARAFGTSANVAECGAGLLAVGGRLIVSEPPPVARALVRPAERWPLAGLDIVGMAPGGRLERGGFGFQILEKVSRIPEIYPRRRGLPGTRPLF